MRIDLTPTGFLIFDLENNTEVVFSGKVFQEANRPLPSFNRQGIECTAIPNKIGVYHLFSKGQYGYISMNPDHLPGRTAVSVWEVAGPIGRKPTREPELLIVLARPGGEPEWSPPPLEAS
jgi:hypothetical protein